MWIFVRTCQEQHCRRVLQKIHDFLFWAERARVFYSQNMNLLPCSHIIMDKPFVFFTFIITQYNINISYQVSSTVSVSFCWFVFFLFFIFTWDKIEAEWAHAVVFIMGPQMLSMIIIHANRPSHSIFVVFAFAFGLNKQYTDTFNWVKVIFIPIPNESLQLPANIVYGLARLFHIYIYYIKMTFI